jgi:hypothetical protein
MQFLIGTFFAVFSIYFNIMSLLQHLHTNVFFFLIKFFFKAFPFTFHNNFLIEPKKSKHFYSVPKCFYGVKFSDFLFSFHNYS